MRKRLEKKREQRNRAMYFILSRKGKTYPIPIDFIGPMRFKKLTKWGRCFENIKRRTVDRTEVDPQTTVSTIFLGLNHCHWHGPPILFETMVFHGGESGDCWRYTTIEKARRGHRKAVDLCRGKDDNG